MKKILVALILFFNLIAISQYAKDNNILQGIKNGQSIKIALGTSTSNNTPPVTPKTELTDPLDLGDDGPQKLIGRIINAALGVVGSIALLMFTYGGFVWMTAAGGSESVTKGKNILVWASIGLIVIFSSYAMVNFMLEGLGAVKKTESEDTGGS